MSAPSSLNFLCVGGMVKRRGKKEKRSLLSFPLLGAWPKHLTGMHSRIWKRGKVGRGGREKGERGEKRGMSSHTLFSP